MGDATWKAWGWQGSSILWRPWWRAQGGHAPSAELYESWHERYGVCPAVCVMETWSRASALDALFAGDDAVRAPTPAQIAGLFSRRGPRVLPADVERQLPRSHVEPTGGSCPVLDGRGSPESAAVFAAAIAREAARDAADVRAGRVPPSRKRAAKRSRWTRAWRDILRMRDTERRSARNTEAA